MRFSQSWIVTSKDFETFRKRRNVIYTIFVVPFIVSILLGVVVCYIQHRSKGPVSRAELVVLLPAFAFLYVILAGLIPTTIASYSMVGEKIEKSLEPLLATATTDTEILFGKGVAAFVPPMAALLGGAALFMGLTDIASFGSLGTTTFQTGTLQWFSSS